MDKLQAFVSTTVLIQIPNVPFYHWICTVLQPQLISHLETGAWKGWSCFPHFPLGIIMDTASFSVIFFFPK